MQPASRTRFQKVTLAENRTRTGVRKAIPVGEAKELVIQSLMGGAKVAQAMAQVQRTVETYRDWRKTDPVFKQRVDELRESRTEARNEEFADIPDFETFCREYLKQPLYLHQLRMLDTVEGRKPRDLHESMTYEPGYRHRVLINIPPEHAKTTTFSVNYVLWQIHKNPDIRVVIMSQGRELAKRILGEIKFKLTSPLYAKMHARFAPEGGWKNTEAEWSADAIYVKGKGGDKDPTVQALGLGSQIYGTRSDLIILDDAITTKNARDIDHQMILLDREIESRLPSEQEGGGKLLIFGTRIAPLDLYRTLNDVVDGDEERVWTYFRQPAVLDYGDGESSSWTTLWPEKWNGRSLSKRRRHTSWNLVYQQLDVADNMTFAVEAVDASINGKRFPGPMGIGAGHREGGMDGLYVVAGLDPATVGNTAMVVVGFDPTTQKRYVLDGFNKANTRSGEMLSEMKRLTEVYGIDEWVIERNAFQRFITDLPDLTDFMRAHACRITPHYTTSNKADDDWGIQTMAPLFMSCGIEEQGLVKWRRTPEHALIELPSTRQNAWVNDLVQQLQTWQPSGLSQTHKTDLVMALWFTHISIQQRLGRKRIKTTHMDSPFRTRSALRRQSVVNLADLRRAKLELQEATA